MEFTIEFYETNAGIRPVQEFLDALKTSDPDDFAAVLAGLAKLRNRQYHREPLTKALGDGLFELRHVGKLNTRVLWFFMKGRRIVAVHGIRNKGQAIAARDLDTAREWMRDWLKRKGTRKRQTLTATWPSRWKTRSLPRVSNRRARRGMWPCNSPPCASKPAFRNATSLANSRPRNSRSAASNLQATKAIP